MANLTGEEIPAIQLCSCFEPKIESWAGIGPSWWKASSTASSSWHTKNPSLSSGVDGRGCVHGIQPVDTKSQGVTNVQNAPL